MTVQLSNINLAAFTCSLRSIRRNGVIYAGEPVYKLAQAMRISPTTCKKYIGQLKDLGLLAEGRRGHLRLVKFTVSLSALFPQYQNNKAFRHVRFFAGQVKTTNWKTFKERITFALAQVNFERQAYRIRENKSIDTLTTGRYCDESEFKILKRLKKRHGADSFDAIGRTARRIKSIVSGRNHLSQIIGCSPSLATLLLRKWNDSLRIVRKVIRGFISCVVNTDSYYALKAQGYFNLRPVPERTGYAYTKGSQITLLEHPTYPAVPIKKSKGAGSVTCMRT